MWVTDILWGRRHSGAAAISKNNDILWGDSILWGTNLVWGNDILWGDSILAGHQRRLGLDVWSTLTFW